MLIILTLGEEITVHSRHLINAPFCYSMKQMEEEINIIKPAFACLHLFHSPKCRQQNQRLKRNGKIKHSLMDGISGESRYCFRQEGGAETDVDGRKDYW